MAYASWSVVFAEQPSAAKWNILGTNDAAFNNGTGIPSSGAIRSYVVTSETTASTSFTDLATVQNVTAVVGTTGFLLVGYGCQISNSGANGTYMTVALSSANTYAATANDAVINVSTSPIRPGTTRLFTSLTPGSTIVTAKFQADAGTGTFSRRELWAVPL